MKPNPVPDEQETVLWTGSYSGKAMIGQWVGVALLTVVLIVIGLLLGGVGVLVTGAIAAILWAITIGQWAIRKLGYAYELTNQRLKHRAGILNRTNDRIELIDVDDVIYKQGIVQAMLGVGDVSIRSSDVSNPELTLRGIDRVKEVSDMIDNARRAERRKRGVYVETV
ncbi:MAG TPA: hypothetical protein DCQ98_05045 [Planctomycetaceae bacterium]|nr:hypothetical protein [Planctomycetaceae bacterium]HRF02556.1 PH domain-containing protein [Pirellulaceae bacterium]